MGLILDTSVLIAAEKQQFDLPRFFEDHPDEPFFVAAITVSELLHGVERAPAGLRRNQRSSFVEGVLTELGIIDFDTAVARRHAAVWAALEKNGRMIGAHDLLIAATARHYHHGLVTLNTTEFKQVHGLLLVETAPYEKRPSP
jgi:tRNA(fMet)-specific endonuclease VapC